MSVVITPDKTRAHVVYKASDGKRVPGVTTILGVLAKPALIRWANRMGLQGTDTTKYVDEKADIGTCCHYMIQCDVNGVGPDLSGYSPNNVDRAENGFLKWLEWKGSHDFTPMLSEAQFVSEKHRYGGTIDILADVDGKATLVDIKTSGSGIWPEMRHQVAAYRMLLLEHNHAVDECRILRVGRDENEGFEESVVNNLGAHEELFLLCRRLYDLQKTAK